MTRPHITISYCIGCRWLTRASWVAQELLTTFQPLSPTVSLTPSPTAGTFSVEVNGQLVWDRASKGRFPELKELKQLVRDVINPDQGLGHSDNKPIPVTCTFCPPQPLIVPENDAHDSCQIAIGARDSPLSIAQVQEVIQELHAKVDSRWKFRQVYMKTVGDRNLKQSLRQLDRTDFFTKDLDEALLAGKVRITVHSAKDLPERIPDGLRLVAITAGLDSADVLVLPEGYTISSLPANAKIGCSSERREAQILSLRGDLKSVDIRGTVDARLAKIDSGELMGVVTAECALQRLGLNPNRIRLDGHAYLQGQLAVVARTGDEAMRRIFAPLDSTGLPNGGTDPFRVGGAPQGGQAANSSISSIAAAASSSSRSPFAAPALVPQCRGATRIPFSGGCAVAEPLLAFSAASHYRAAQRFSALAAPKILPIPTGPFGWRKQFLVT